MAQMNLSAVVSHPLLTDSLVYLRNQLTVLPDGEGTVALQPVPTPFRGIVRNPDGRRLNRLPEGERIDAVIEVHTAVELIAGGNGDTADIVIWNGQQYTVRKVRDYSNFGYVAAECELVPVPG